MVELEQRPLGGTGVHVSVLAYGAMELRGAPRGRDLTEPEVGRILNAVLDGGITLIDTSIDYEHSEERIGHHLAHRRDEYLLASKCGCQVGWKRPADYPGGLPGGGPHDFSRENIVAGVEQSLRRLRTDHLDLLQVHASPDAETLRQHGVIETMQELRHQGKVRFLGMSGVLPTLVDHVAMDVFDVFQIPYSVVQRQHEQVISDAGAAGAGVLVRGGAGRGAPSGESKAIEKSPELATNWEQASLDDLLDGMSPMEFTLRFSISHPAVSAALVGTADIDHLTQNLAAVAKGPLPPAVHAEALQRLGS